MDDFIVFASLPDMGQVGGLVSKHLIRELKTEKIADIRIFEKPWAKIQEGLITSVVDTFEIFSNQDHKIIIFSGTEQPQDPNNLLNLCRSLFRLINKIGTPKQIYTAGGYHVPHLTGTPKVFAVATDNNIILNLKEKGIKIFSKEIEIITWFNGLVMAVAQEMGFDAIGLFGEISETNKSQPLTAKSVVQIFSKLENIYINTDKFDVDHNSQIREDKGKVSLGGPRKKDHNPGIG